MAEIKTALHAPAIADPIDRNRMPNEHERFDDWWASACVLPPYTLEHLRWAFNAGGMAQREIQDNMVRRGCSPEVGHHVWVSADKTCMCGQRGIQFP